VTWALDRRLCWALGECSESRANQQRDRIEQTPALSGRSKWQNLERSTFRASSMRIRSLRSNG
jgi:hypothetical protein